MGEPPPGFVIDRIDNDGNYEPDNCRWVDRSTSNKNVRLKTHCKRGHELTPENVRVVEKGPGLQPARHCRACARERMRDRRNGSAG